MDSIRLLAEAQRRIDKMKADGDEEPDVRLYTNTNKPLCGKLGHINSTGGWIEIDVKNGETVMVSTSAVTALVVVGWKHGKA